MERTPYFKAFGPLLFGRRAKSGMEKIRKLEGLEDLYEVLGDLFSEKLLGRSDKGVNSRERTLPPMVTFWAFVAQALSPGSSCRDAVKRVEAWWRWASLRTASTLSDEAYCKARRRLNLGTLHLIRQQSAWHLERNVWKEEKWGEGRVVKIVDGTTLSMPDTQANQKAWPQSGGQKEGCGFPLMKLVGLFSLSSGALLEEAHGNKHQHEATLFRTLWGKLEKGDIVLEDRGFCSFVAMAALLEKGVDTVARLHQARLADFRRGKILGKGDRLVVWTKPVRCAKGWSQEEFEALPQTLAVRLIKLIVETPGYRTRSVLLATTLTDAEVYPAEELRRLYAQRWNVELHYAQIKTTLGMDILRCKSPEMIERELQINLIAYNFVRALMQRAAHTHDVELARLSFKGSLDTLRHWATVIHAAKDQPRKQQQLISHLLLSIASDPVPLRPGRSQPRAKKRRPKNFQLLTKPRHLMGNLPHRNRPSKNHPKTPLS